MKEMNKPAAQAAPFNKRSSGPILLSFPVQVASLRSAAREMPAPSLCSGRIGS